MSKKKIAGVLFLGVVGLIVVAGITSGGDSSTSTSTASAGASSASSASAPPPSWPAGQPVTQAPVAQAPAPVEAPPAQTGPLTTFGNGTYEIGVDIAPGKYRSPGVQDSYAPLCYWDTTDANGKIVDQGVANEGPSRATLKKGLTFKSSGCEDWSLQK